jgi:hypothetical protein
MSVLKNIAYYQNRRDEVPNQEVAKELAQTRNAADIREIVQNLSNKEPNVQSDCLKVLYELGYLAPELIAEYVDEFIKLLGHPNNRMVWGDMIAISTIAGLQADVIFPHVAEIKKTMETGSVITNDAGMKALAKIAARNEEYRDSIIPTLFDRFKNSRPVDAPRYAEFILGAIDRTNKVQFTSLLLQWIASASGSRLARLRKVFKQVEGIS